MKPAERILLATDFSRSSQEAAHVAAGLARQLNAAIDLVTVIDTASEIGDSADLAYRAQRLIEMRQQARESAEGFVLKHLFGPAPVLVHVRDGIPAAEIVRAARDFGCDFVVLGTHGRTGLSHLLMGSVAEKVVRHSTVPVITVRGPGADASAPKVCGIDERIVWG